MSALTATTRVAGVIGSPVRHSLSPVIQNAAFAECGLDWAFVAFEVPPGSGAAAVDAMRVLGIDGLSVTMPHKVDVVPRLDRLSAEAAALGAVNCIARDGDELVGHSTDGHGFVDALRTEGVDPAGRSFAVLGAGGAARALVVSLAAAGAARVAVVNRSADRAAAVAALAPDVTEVADAADAAEVDVVVNATSVGMVGTAGEGSLPLPIELLGAHQTVVDIVYHPVLTPFLAAAADRGLATVDGVGMLVHQAAHAFRLWTGHDAPVEAMSAGARAGLGSPAP